MQKVLYIIFILFAGTAYGQYQLNNDANQTGSNPDCFDLTTDNSSRSGQVWNNTLFNLNNYFEIYATLNFGNDPQGGKGMAFLFHQSSLLAGIPNQAEMGFNGISPSIVVEMDSYQDFSDTDPPFDHGALMRNGSRDHGSTNNLQGPVALLANQATVKDGANHMFHLIWDPAVNRLEVWFNCNKIIDYTGDVVNNIFGSDPNVYWGFTAGTGGPESNIHSVCIDYTSLEPATMWDDTACQGVPIVSNAGYGYEYAWSPSAGLQDDSAQFAIATPSSTTTYTVSIFDSCGQYRTDQYTHSIVDSNIAVLSGDTHTCDGVPVPLDIDVQGSPPYIANIFNGAGTTQYNLDGNGHDINTGQPITVTPGATTTYEIIGFNGSNNCGADWSGTATVTLDILDGIQTTETDATCFGRCNGFAQFNIPHATSEYTYIWPDFTGGTSKSSLCAGDYDIAVDNGGGCQDTFTLTVEQPDRIELNPLPDVIACANETITVSANASGGSGNYSYNWSTQESTQSIDIATTVSTSYAVTVTDDNNCPAATENFTLTIRPLLDLTVSQDTGLCTGAPLQISATAAGGDSNYTFAWNDASSSSTAVLNDTPFVSTNYIVTLTDGCGSEPQIDTVTVTVDNYRTHTYSIDQPVCSENFADITIDDYDPSADYVMSFNRGLGTDTVDGGQLSKFVTDTGCYDITLYVESEYCDSTRRDSCPLYVNMTPEAELSTEPEDFSELTSFEGVFINRSRTEYQETEWYIDGDLIGFDDSVTHVFQDSGTYNLMMVIENAAGCLDSAFQTLLIRGERADIYVPNAFSPNNDGLNDTFFPVIRDRDITEYEFIIFNRWGQEVFKTNEVDEGWDGSVNNAHNQKSQSIYIWKLQYRDRSGELIQDEGTVLLYR